MGTRIGVHAVIKGRVQGVFFRLETQRAAERLGVKGWVRNRSNGDVEAVFEAEPDIMEKMIQWCYQGSQASHVTDVISTPQDTLQDFSSFDIRY